MQRPAWYVGADTSNAAVCCKTYEVCAACCWNSL